LVRSRVRIREASRGAKGCRTAAGDIVRAAMLKEEMGNDRKARHDRAREAATAGVDGERVESGFVLVARQEVGCGTLIGSTGIHCTAQRKEEQVVTATSLRMAES
jgi:hypothetical protein